MTGTHRNFLAQKHRSKNRHRVPERGGISEDHVKTALNITMFNAPRFKVLTTQGQELSGPRSGFLQENSGEEDSPWPHPAKISPNYVRGETPEERASGGKIR